MGWKQGSKIPAVCIHLAADDIHAAQALLNGINLETSGYGKENITNLNFGQSCVQDCIQY
jgi:hypothetical protein